MTRRHNKNSGNRIRQPELHNPSIKNKRYNKKRKFHQGRETKQQPRCKFRSYIHLPHTSIFYNFLVVMGFYRSIVLCYPIMVQGTTITCVIRSLVMLILCYIYPAHWGDQCSEFCDHSDFFFIYCQ